MDRTRRGNLSLTYIGGRSGGSSLFEEVEGASRFVEGGEGEEGGGKRKRSHFSKKVSLARGWPIYFWQRFLGLTFWARYLDRTVKY